jgi:hypothetical protein
VGDLAGTSRRQESQAHQSSCRSETGCFNQADEPTVLAAEAGDDCAHDGRRFSHPGLSRIQHPRGALDLERSCIGHVDFDQKDGHVPMVA